MRKRYTVYKETDTVERAMVKCSEERKRKGRGSERKRKRKYNTD